MEYFICMKMQIERGSLAFSSIYIGIPRWRKYTSTFLILNSKHFHSNFWLLADTFKVIDSLVGYFFLAFFFTILLRKKLFIEVVRISSSTYHPAIKILILLSFTHHPSPKVIEANSKHCYYLIHKQFGIEL